MKQKLLVLFAGSLFVAGSLNAQFRKSIGGGIVYGTGQIPKGASADAETPTIFGYGVFFHPRYTISESERGSFSVGIPLTAGLGGSYNSRESSALTILLDLPLTAEYNFGLGSTEDQDAGFGGFIGGGFSYTYSNFTTSFVIPGFANSTDEVKGSSYGPMIHAGIKTMISEKVFGLRLFYKMGLETAKFKTFGLAVAYEL